MSQIDFALTVGEELKVRIECFAEDEQPGASYDDTVETKWINPGAVAVEITHDGKLHGSFKGLQPGISRVTVMLKNHAGQDVTVSFNVTVSNKVRDTVRIEVVKDI